MTVTLYSGHYTKRQQSYADANWCSGHLPAFSTNEKPDSFGTSIELQSSRKY